MIPDKTVVPGVKFTREFFKFLQLMIGENFDGSIPFLCPYYEDGKYATEQTEDGWPIPDNFCEMTYPYLLVVGPADEEGLHKLSVIQNPQSEGYKENLLELLDMTEGDGKIFGNLTAEQAYDYVSKKYKECSASWPTDEPWY